MKNYEKCGQILKPIARQKLYYSDQDGNEVILSRLSGTHYQMRDGEIVSKYWVTNNLEFKYRELGRPPKKKAIFTDWYANINGFRVRDRL